MNRRAFLNALCLLPGLGWLKPEPEVVLWEMWIPKETSNTWTERWSELELRLWSIPWNGHTLIPAFDLDTQYCMDCQRAITDQERLLGINPPPCPGAHPWKWMELDESGLPEESPGQPAQEGERS